MVKHAAAILVELSGRRKLICAYANPAKIKKVLAWQVKYSGTKYVVLSTNRSDMETTQKETFRDIINGETPVLVDFFAEWCGPCKVMKPVLQQLHQDMGEKVRILKLDVDKSPETASAFGISGVPTFILFHKGKIAWRQSGVLTAKQLEQVITTNTR